MNIEKNKALLRQITIHWWNMGTKQLDYSGTYKDWFENRKIKITEYNNKISFTGTIGGMEFKLKYRNFDYEHLFNQVIKLYMVYMGDKAQLTDGFNRVYKMNWR